MYSVQVSRYPTAKSSYTTVLHTDNEAQAYAVYRAYNIGNGYKKRLLHNSKTIATYKS